jgi:hypothetical protein
LAELSEGKETLSPHSVAVAALPTAALLFLALFVLPRQFRSFAKQYAREHPDVIEAAAAEQRSLSSQDDGGEGSDGGGRN